MWDDKELNTLVQQGLDHILVPIFDRFDEGCYAILILRQKHVNIIIQHGRITNRPRKIHGT